MSFAGHHAIAFSAVEATLIWRILHQHAERLAVDMLALEERVRGGNNGTNLEAWRALSTEHAMVKELAARFMAEVPGPTVTDQ